MSLDRTMVVFPANRGPLRDTEGRERESVYATLYSHHCSQLPAREIRRSHLTDEKLQHGSRELNPFEYSSHKSHHVKCTTTGKIFHELHSACFKKKKFGLTIAFFNVTTTLLGFACEVAVGSLSSVQFTGPVCVSPVGLDWLRRVDRKRRGLLCPSGWLLPHILFSRCIKHGLSSVWECLWLPVLSQRSILLCSCPSLGQFSAKLQVNYY